ncbi:MAG: hypothetical protein ACRD1Z_19270, partial [Vicinamibacteria bacterium]
MRSTTPSGWIAVLPSIGACAGEGPKPTPALALESCQLGAAGSPSRLAARCGVLRVPEDRSKRDGRSIDLRIAVVPAVSRNPARDPLV